MRDKIRKGQTLKTPSGGILHALSDETASGEVLVRCPGDLRRCVYLPVGDVTPIKLNNNKPGRVKQWLQLARQ